MMTTSENNKSKPELAKAKAAPTEGETVNGGKLLRGGSGHACPKPDVTVHKIEKGDRWLCACGVGWLYTDSKWGMQWRRSRASKPKETTPSEEKAT